MMKSSKQRTPRIKTFLGSKNFLLFVIIGAKKNKKK